MSMNEADTRYHLIDPVLREKGYVSRECITLETVLTPAPVEPSGPKGRRRKGPGRTDYLLCVQVGDMPKPLPVAVLEAKKETDDPLKGMQQARGYADTLRFDVKYVFLHQRPQVRRVRPLHRLINGPFQFSDFPRTRTSRHATPKTRASTWPAPKPPCCSRPTARRGRSLATTRMRPSAPRSKRSCSTSNKAKPPRVLLTLATGAGKTIIATNLLWRLPGRAAAQARAVFVRPR
jgi:type I restriction enzyme R subunit